MLSATSADATLSRLDCSITLDISTGSNGETIVANLAAVPEIERSNASRRNGRRVDAEEEEDDEKHSEAEQLRDDTAGENGNEQQAVSLLALAGGARATHGIIGGRGCYEVYVKSVQ